MLLFAGAAGSNVTTPAPAPKKAAPQKSPSVLDPAADAAAAAVPSQPAYRRYVHPQAKAMAGVDLARISASPLGKRLATQIDGLGLKQKALAEGMDFASDVEKVLFSSPGELGAKEGQTKLSGEAPFLVSMQGKFKIDRLRKSLMARKSTRQVYLNAEVWMPAKGDTGLAIVNSQVMLLGDRKSLHTVLDAHASGADADPDEENPVIKRAAELGSQYDVWLVSDASIEGLGAATPVPQAEMLNGIDQFELGISLRQGLKADVSLHGRTPEETSKLGTMLAGLKALMALSVQQKKEPELTAMLDKLNIGTSGERVMVSVQFSQKDLDRGIDSMMANTPGAKVATAAKPAQIAPAGPLMVRIYNADGGDREFPLNR